MEYVNSKKPRVPNFTPSEKDLLVDLIAMYPAITCKKTDKLSRNTKKAAWDKLTNEFNASGLAATMRSSEALLKCWKNIESRTKTIRAQQNRERIKTGGGPKVIIESDSITDKVEGI